jgi:hypothetical protein
MTDIGKFPADYVWNAQEAFELQLDSLDNRPVSELVEKYFLRNLIISLELHFASRNQAIEIDGGSLQELRDVSILFLHDAKAPVARAYLEELVDGVFGELAERFLA